MVRLVAVVALVAVGLASPLMGMAAAEEYEGRKFYGAFEGDWFFLFGFIAAAACARQAVHLIRGSSRRG